MEERALEIPLNQTASLRKCLKHNISYTATDGCYACREQEGLPTSAARYCGKHQLGYARGETCWQCKVEQEAQEKAKTTIADSLSKSTYTEQFDTELIKTVNADRAAIYGHPLDNFRRAEALLAEVHDCKDPELRHALQMILVKVARLVQSPNHFDSWLDVAGYARCAMLIMDKRKQDAMASETGETS